MPEQRSTGQIRTFIAVPIPEKLKLDVDKLIVGFKPLASGISWVRAANLHFTLRFLGDIDSNSISSLKQAVESQMTGITQFNICLSGLGCFPNLNRPRVVWVSADGDTDKMTELANRVENACRECGYGQADKPFAPHLTIGRVKFPSGSDKLVESLKTTRFKTDQFSVDKVVIYKSDLTPRGPIYTSMGEIGLGKL
jgi:RNA 2',3'-cyclic 3'-phosphodiesterase